MKPSATCLPPDRPKSPPNPATNRYVEAPGFFKLPAGRKMGASSAVRGDSKGNIWVVDRCAANSCVGSKLAPIMQFDGKGNFIKSFGAGLMQFPHGFTIDSKDPTESYQDYLKGEVRYTSLLKAFPDQAGELFQRSEEEAAMRLANLKRMAGE